MKFFEKVESSFKASLKGQETVDILIYYWGIPAYLFTYFIIERIIKMNSIRFIDITLSLITASYFAWHIYALRKCAPKKPKISDEEKKALRIEARKTLGKRMWRKFMLQEPMTKWDPVFVSIVVDVFSIAIFVGYSAS